MPKLECVSGSESELEENLYSCRPDDDCSPDDSCRPD